MYVANVSAFALFLLRILILLPEKTKPTGRFNNTEVNMICETCAKDLVLALAAAILGVAFPLLVGAIQRIDDKYGSTRLVGLFAKERATICFCFFLIATIIELFAYIVILPKDWEVKLADTIWYDAWGYMAAVCCIGMVVGLLWVVYLIRIYYDAPRLQKRLLQGNVSLEKRKAWFELWAAIIKKTDNIDVLRPCYQFYYEWITNYRKGKEKKEVEYPPELYDGVIAMNEILCASKKKVVSIHNGNDIITALWDDFQQTRLSAKTYHVIWTCLLQQLYYKRYDRLVVYWRMAHQHLLFSMQSYYEGERIQDNKGNFVTITAEEASQRESDRKKFKEFHTALGAMFLYKKEYGLLKQMLYYSNAQLPQYVLLYNNLAEIIPAFMEILADTLDSPFRFERDYPFLDLQAGVRNNSIINGWIQRYLALMVMRLYTLPQDYIYRNSLFTLPDTPAGLAVKQAWLDNIPLLKTRLQEVSKADWLKEVLEEDAASLNMYQRMKRLSGLLDDLKDQLQGKIQKQRQGQPLSDKEVREFNDVIADMTDRNLAAYREALSGNVTQNYNEYDIHATIREVEPLEAFADEKTISYINIKESLSAMLLHMFRGYLLNTFTFKHPLQYRVFTENMDMAIKKLQLNKDEHLILCIGLEAVSIWKDAIPQSEGRFATSDGIEIQELPGEFNSSMDRSLVILNKCDVPQLEFMPPSDGIKEKFHLEKIDDAYQLYTSVVKLKEDEELYDLARRRGIYSSKQLQESVMVNADINARIRWKLYTHMVQIKVLYQYLDNGSDNLNSISPFNRYYIKKA